MIFVINNDGYTVERMIHGMKEPTMTFACGLQIITSVFGGDNVLVHDVNTSEELMLTFEKLNLIVIACTL